MNPKTRPKAQTECCAQTTFLALLCYPDQTCYSPACRLLGQHAFGGVTENSRTYPAGLLSPNVGAVRSLCDIRGSWYPASAWGDWIAPPLLLHCVPLLSFGQGGPTFAVTLTSRLGTPPAPRGGVFFCASRSNPRGRSPGGQ